MNSILEPIKKIFLNPQFTAMIVVIAMITLMVLFTGKYLAPFFAALIIAYLLEGIITRAGQHGRLSRGWMVHIVFILFMLFVIGVLFWAVPEIGRQAKQAASNIPLYLNAGQELILKLPETYPEIFSKDQALNIVAKINREITNIAQSALSGGVIAPLVWTVAFVVYLILVPVMVYFLLKDKKSIIRYLRKYFPSENPFLRSVWDDVDMQIGNYIRGKVTEIIVIWFASFVTFTLLGLDYAMLLSFMVGMSVLIPYIGATIVTIPVLAVAFVQWGVGSQFYMLAIAYFIIQIIDGNVLVPLIFSEAVNIHPVAIIIAVLFFGGVWGFWGVFFAIPLATVIKAVMNAWIDSLEELEAQE